VRLLIRAFSTEKKLCLAESAGRSGKSEAEEAADRRGTADATVKSVNQRRATDEIHSVSSDSDRWKADFFL
jgi:hypothetical protein